MLDVRQKSKEYVLEHAMSQQQHASFGYVI